jgi:hypothetical protein
MTIPKFVKYGVLAGCAACFVATAVMGFWPAVLNSTRIPLYTAEVGAWCIFITICYLVFKFVRAGLRRSRS